MPWFNRSLRHLFWSSEEHPSEDQLVNEKGRSVYVHQPLLLLCGAISHICYCLQTLYFFKVGPVPRVLRIDGIEKNCDQDLDKHALDLLKALVRFPFLCHHFYSLFIWCLPGFNLHHGSGKFLQAIWCWAFFAPFHRPRDGSNLRTLHMNSQRFPPLSFTSFPFFSILLLQTCLSSAIEGLFELCLRIRTFFVIHICAHLIAHKDFRFAS